MKKVCHVTSVHPPEDGRIFRKECVSLANAGYDVSLVQQGGSYEKDGVHIVGVGAIPASRKERMFRFSKKVYETALNVDADIYHLHDPELLLYALKLKRKGKKVIFDSHERYTELFAIKGYLPRWCRGLIAFAYGTLERYVLRRIDGLVFPCLLQGKNPMEGRCPHIAIVNNVALLNEMYDHYDPNLEKYERSICYLGGLNHDRGITHIVKTAAAADCTAYLGGNFDSRAYQTQLESMEEYSHVKYLGVLDRQQARELLMHCRIGMANLLNVSQYNRYDNMPTKVYEYMALGLPVILSRAPYNEKMMQQYQFGVCVDPENVEEMAAVIRYLLEHPEEMRRMGENGRRAVKEEFNWGVEEKKLFALYEEILKD